MVSEHICCEKSNIFTGLTCLPESWPKDWLITNCGS